jgi:histidinol-phosphatase (PHP family)
MTEISKVSVHGGHSGEFCNHAANTLEEVIQAYIAQDFQWVGITEHAPAYSDDLLYTDQKEAGLTPEFLLARFGAYMRECRRLQGKYRDSITIFAAMEIETYRDYHQFVPHLCRLFEPDYIVGSIHFVNDINFDYSPQQYAKAVAASGGIDELYEAYFDLQYEMVRCLQPAVVGHFDIIRIFDPGYRGRLRKPAIAAKVERNLKLIAELRLIMDYNLRALHKGADEPYITESILNRAHELGIAVVPGDDSHGVATVGNYMERGISNLQRHGFSPPWQTPAVRPEMK